MSRTISCQSTLVQTELTGAPVSLAVVYLEELPPKCYEGGRMNLGRGSDRSLLLPTSTNYAHHIPVSFPPSAVPLHTAKVVAKEIGGSFLLSVTLDNDVSSYTAHIDRTPSEFVFLPMVQRCAYPS
jgi:hypothetical protein